MYKRQLDGSESPEEMEAWEKAFHRASFKGQQCGAFVSCSNHPDSNCQCEVCGLYFCKEHFAHHMNLESQISQYPLDKRRWIHRGRWYGE